MSEPPRWVPPATPGVPGPPGTPPPGGLPPSQADPALASPPWQGGTAYPYGGYPPAPAKPKQTLSVVAFVLGVLGCIPLASIAAIVVGAIAYSKERAGRAFAITGMVLGALWTLVGVTLILTDAPQRFADSVQESVSDIGVPMDGDYDSRLTEDLAVGDCFDDPFVGDFSLDTDREITVVDCAQPHDLEVYEILVLDEYTDPEQMYYDTDAACIDRFRDFVGIDYGDSGLIVYAYYPSRASWDAGNRTVTCTVTDFGQTTGTLRGANR